MGGGRGGGGGGGGCTLKVTDRKVPLYIHWPRLNFKSHDLK